jgi:hypothetical protein
MKPADLPEDFSCHFPLTSRAPPYRFYTIFIFTHVIMFVAVLIAGLIHGATVIIAGLVILVLDNLFRYCL